MLPGKKVLVLAPHTDDGEFGCGGTIARLTREGKEIFYTAFSSCEKSVPIGFPADILKKEVRNAVNILGIKPDNLTLLDYPVRDFPKYRQDILENMILLKKEIKPDLVLLPSTFDTHQDHQVIVQEGFRAFKDLSLFGYEVPHNNLQFKIDLFVKLSQEDLTLKLSGLECYKSQYHRPYAQKEYIEALAKMRGGQINTPYAEIFEVIRWIG